LTAVTFANNARFKAQFDLSNQEFSLSGTLRPQSVDEITPSLALLRHSIDRVNGVLYINVRRLGQMNYIAFHAFARAAPGRTCGSSS
jgi:hypothetical protein